MTCIIVDDEPLAVEGMQLNITEIRNLNLIGSFFNALDAHHFLKDNAVDLMFLDINMPHLSGLEFAKALLSPPMIIFTTAYSEYAVESYEVSAVDYLTKPVRFERFFKAVSKAEEQWRLKQKGNLETNERPSVTDYVLIKADRRTHRLALNDILFIEGLKDYVLVYTPTEKLPAAMNIKTIAAQLPEQQFVRVNKSYIININCINSFDTDFLKIGTHEIPIGAAFKQSFLSAIAGDKLLKR